MASGLHLVFKIKPGSGNVKELSINPDSSQDEIDGVFNEIKSAKAAKNKLKIAAVFFETPSGEKRASSISEPWSVSGIRAYIADIRKDGEPGYLFRELAGTRNFPKDRETMVFDDKKAFVRHLCKDKVPDCFLDYLDFEKVAMDAVKGAGIFAGLKAASLSGGGFCLIS